MVRKGSEEEVEEDEQEVEVKDEDEEGDEVTEMGPSGAAEAAVHQAEAEGLTLQPSNNNSGYRGVRKNSDGRKPKPFYATVWRDSKKVHLGYFGTAEEAALAYARTPEAQAQVANPKAPRAVPLTAEEAVAQAAAEGLKFEPGSGAAGYKGVKVDGSRYQANVWRAGQKVYFGCFATAEEAALAVARADARAHPPAASPAAAKRAAPPQKPPPAKLHPKANSKEPTAAPNPAAASTASVRLEVGQSVDACFGGGRAVNWFPGVVQHINEDGTLAIDYDDGDQEERVLRKHVRPKARPPSPLASTSSGRLRTAPQRLDASLLVASSRSCSPAGEASAFEAAEDSEEDSEDELSEHATLTADAVDRADAAEAAVRQAAAEGLTLQPSDNNSGYLSVRKNSDGRKPKPFQAMVWRASKDVHLGYFGTAEEAALAYARTPEAQAQVANPKAVPLTAEEAVAQAAAEGLKLEPGSGAAGYKGVGVDGSRYKARVKPAGKWVHLGCFATAKEAALAVARADARTNPPAASPAAAKRAAPPPSNSKPPPAKQPRHTPPPRPAHPVSLPQHDASAPKASPKLEAAAAAAAPAPVIFKHKLALLKRELAIAPATPAIPAVAEANQQMGITPSLGESLGSQLDRLLAIISG
jgi:hypothetical protein